MPKTARLTITLPRELIEAVDQERKARGEIRSQFLRRAIQALRQKERELPAVEQYVEGYRKLPESPEETELADRTGTAVLSGEPWE